ncbi:hypothetical protein NIES22_43740 [Calothrix brevissima NIES-22]|nr:hypothetical protein NIES22_43740 [Calothrix brevissima NIES-22]
MPNDATEGAGEPFRQFLPNPQCPMPNLINQRYNLEAEKSFSSIMSKRPLIKWVSKYVLENVV